MRDSTYNAPCQTMMLGWQGENNALRVNFDISAFFADFGTGVAKLMFRRHGDENFYVPSGIMQNGTTLSWVLDSTDTAKPGMAEVQLVYLVGETVAKDYIFSACILPSAEAGAPGPEPYREYLVRASVDGNTLTIVGSDGEEVVFEPSATNDHRELTNRDAEDSHPISAITGLTAELESLTDDVVGLDERLDDVEDVIPDQATASNQLADKNFVNSSVATNTAYFRGTYDVVADLGLTYDATEEEIATALTTVVTEKTNNDYVFVYFVNPTTGVTEKYERFKYSSEDGWAYEFTLNNSSFTANQWAAINSGITAGKVALIDTALQPADIADRLKEPTSGLAAGKYFRIASIDESGHPVLETADIDYEERIGAIEDVIPEDASASNQLADKAFVASHYLPSQPKNLKGLAHIVQTGYADTLEIGTQFTIPWRDVAAGVDYDVPVDIVSVQDVEDEDGKTHRAAIIQWHYTTPFTIQFDASEGVPATEANAEDGMYYYGKTGSNYTLLSLSAGDPIPYSDYDSVVKNSILDTTYNIFNHGYDRYRDSAWRQFLNSESGVGEWWVATHVGDNAPSQLNSRAGFLSGFSAEDLALMKPCKITCYTNGVTDGSVIDTMYDRWWLASGTEMYGSVNANEGTYFPYWKEATDLTSPGNGANTGRIAYGLANHSSAQRHWLRSAVRGFSCFPWGVNTSGDLNGYGAGGACAALPCCAIY